MTRTLLAGAAALALMTGVAFAQTLSTDSTTSREQTTTTTTITTPVPVPQIGSYSSDTSEKTTDAYGNQIEKSKSYRSDASGTSVSSSAHVVGPDGSERSTVREKQVSPNGAATYSKSTTTTTTGQ